MILSKARLAITLSQLKTFATPDVGTEQYPMDSEIGAAVLWNAYMNGDIEGKRIADLGAGTGILGIGALLLGARAVTFVEADAEAIAVLRKNLDGIPTTGTVEIAHADIGAFSGSADVAIQNPPFGTRKIHADREFLEKAFRVAPVVYSFHKATSAEFLEKFAADHQYAIAGNWLFDFPIKMSQLFHRKNIHRVKVGCWKFVQQVATHGA